MAELRDGEDELLFFPADQLISYQAGWSGSRLPEAMRREKNVGGWRGKTFFSEVPEVPVVSVRKMLSVKVRVS